MVEKYKPNGRELGVDKARDTFELPKLVHSWDSNDIIISSVIAPKRQLVICGTQNGKLIILELDSYRLVNSITEEEMKGSNLCLNLSADENMVFTGGSDLLVKVYDITNIAVVKLVKIIYLSIDIGDIFSIYYCDQLQMLFIGAQNASLLWVKIDYKALVAGYAVLGRDAEVMSRNNMPHLRYSKFFDSKPPSGKMHKRPKKSELLDSISLCEINPNDCIKFAHHAYVYSITTCCNEYLQMKYPNYPMVLLSCGGDGMVHLWGFKRRGKSNKDACIKSVDDFHDSSEKDSKITLEKLETLRNQESIYSFAIQNTYLYVGLSNGCINVWDLLTDQLIKTFRPVDGKEISCLAVLDTNCIIYGNKFGLNIVLPDGQTKPINKKSCLTLYLIETNHSHHIICGGRGTINYFQNNPHTLAPHLQDLALDNNALVKNLSKLIRFNTNLKFSDAYLHDARDCAKFLIKLLDGYGATSHLIPIEESNSIIISKFTRNRESVGNKSVRIVYYGHYDIVDALEDLDEWTTNPFEMTNKNGFLYGRGVSDNKGPTLAIIQAVAEIYANQQLGIDVVFIIDGEEENGSKNFKSHIKQHLDIIGDVDYIFLSNSYWLDDERPCLNYGLRGVINCSIAIESDKPDRHCGVDGGVLKEPTMDMVQLLSTLTSNDKISIPGFYDNVPELDEFELENFEKITNYNPRFKVDELIKKWTKPSLTIHKMEVSGPNNNTVIPKSVACSLSFRIVPNQDIEVIKAAFVNYVTSKFNDLNTTNHLNVKTFDEVEPWLGDCSDKIYKLVYSKIQSNWQQEPLLIREGGSIPTIRFLEKILNAKACQIPCGQASDNAHLKNERIRIVNLFKLKDIFQDILHGLSDST